MSIQKLIKNTLIFLIFTLLLLTLSSNVFADDGNPLPDANPSMTGQIYTNFVGRWIRPLPIGPTNRIVYGYYTDINGLSLFDLFNSGVISEDTAHFTFHGTLEIKFEDPPDISLRSFLIAEGTITIYQWEDPTIVDKDFDIPDSFINPGNAVATIITKIFISRNDSTSWDMNARSNIDYISLFDGTVSRLKSLTGIYNLRLGIFDPIVVDGKTFGVAYFSGNDLIAK